MKKVLDKCGKWSLSKNSFSIFEQAKFLFIKNIKSFLSF